MGEAGWSLPILRKGWSKMEHNVVLTMRGITMTFPGVKALDNVDLTLRKGEIMALMGENGAGKSTLLNLLTAPGMAYAGKILLDGTELRTVSPESLYETVSCPCPALRASSSRTRWNRRRCAAMTAFSF